MSEPAQPTPSTIGHYRVVQVLGAGGMGRVFKCYDDTLDREIAIKVLHDDALALPGMEERFLREARAMAKLSSPHVVTVHQVGTSDIGPYLVMELMADPDVGHELKRGPLDVDTAIDVVRQASLGLEAAADAGLVHRDIKPDNLFRAGAVVKVADFGLARPLDGSANVTQAGVVVGTPHYLAPELVRGAAASLQSDMYALGATFYELVCGEVPFPAASVVEAAAAHVTTAVPMAHQKHPQVPEAIGIVIAKMLAKAPDDRFESYAALREALVHAMASLSTHTKRQNESGAPNAGVVHVVKMEPPAKGPASSDRRPKLLAVGALVGVGAVLTSVMMAAVAIGVFGEGDVEPAHPPKSAEVIAFESRVKSGNWEERHAALQALKDRGVDVTALEEFVGIADIQQGATCKSRRFGLLRLGRVGASQAALDAVHTAQRSPLENGCMLLDTWNVESKIRTRMRSAPKSDEEADAPSTK